MSTTSNFDEGFVSTAESVPSRSSVRDEASNVASDTKTAAKDIAGTVKDEAASVATETKTQVKDLYHQTTTELRDQAAVQQSRVAEGLRSAGEQLRSMAENSEQGVASDAVRQVSERVSSVAGWLDARDPGSLLAEVRSFAARQPGTFLAIAAISGVVVGRLTSSLVANAKDEASAADATDAGATLGRHEASSFDSSLPSSYPLRGSL